MHCGEGYWCNQISKASSLLELILMFGLLGFIFNFGHSFDVSKDRGTIPNRSVRHVTRTVPALEMRNHWRRGRGKEGKKERGEGEGEGERATKVGNKVTDFTKSRQNKKRIRGGSPCFDWKEGRAPTLALRQPQWSSSSLWRPSLSLSSSPILPLPRPLCYDGSGPAWNGMEANRTVPPTDWSEPRYQHNEPWMFVSLFDVCLRLNCLISSM